jgi:hypothetical protein
MAITRQDDFVASLIETSNSRYPRVEYYTFSTTMKRNL